MSSKVQLPEFGESAWRLGLLDRVREVLLAVMVLAGLLAATPLFSSSSARWGGAAVFVAGVLAYFFTRPVFPYKLRAWTAVGFATIFSSMWYFLIGFLPGPVLGVALALVMAALLIGLRAMLVLLLLMVGLQFAVALALWTGAWWGPSAIEIDPTEPLNWLRVALFSGILWSGIALPVHFVVTKLQETLRHQQATLEEKGAALQQLQEKEAQRRLAEKGKREAEAIAQHAQKLESLGQLAAGVAHDFNNALLVIQGWNDIARVSDSAETISQAHEAIEQATHQCEQLAKQLLAFGRKEIRAPKYLLLESIVHDAASTLSRLLADNIELSVECEPGVAVFADESQMQQILFNLVINAKDALPMGGRISIRARRAGAGDMAQFAAAKPHSGDWALLQVEDNGAGMEADIQRFIFDPFFTTKARGQGTGLGLSTVFGIVQQSSGLIDLWSEPGKGTRFTIGLPAVEYVSPELRQVVATDLRAISDVRVLVVEDDPLARELIVYALTREGYAVLEAGDGDSAVRILQEERSPIDLLCTDAVFPGAPLKYILETFAEKFPDGRVLICSGYILEDLAIKGVESGKYLFLPKPFTAANLISKIETVLQSATVAAG